LSRTNAKRIATPITPKTNERIIANQSGGFLSRKIIFISSGFIELPAVATGKRLQTGNQESTSF
jgi:hypothetical protein